MSNSTNASSVVSSATTAGSTAASTTPVPSSTSWLQNRNNVASYIVLPAFVLFIVGCCMIYVGYKAKRYCKRKRRERQHKAMLDKIQTIPGSATDVLAVLDHTETVVEDLDLLETKPDKQPGETDSGICIPHASRSNSPAEDKTFADISNQEALNENTKSISEKIETPNEITTKAEIVDTQYTQQGTTEQVISDVVGDVHNDPKSVIIPVTALNAVAPISESIAEATRQDLSESQQTLPQEEPKKTKKKKKKKIAAAAKAVVIANEMCETISGDSHKQNTVNEQPKQDIEITDMNDKSFNKDDAMAKVVATAIVVDEAADKMIEQVKEPGKKKKKKKSKKSTENQSNGVQNSSEVTLVAASAMQIEDSGSTRKSSVEEIKITHIEATVTVINEATDMYNSANFNAQDQTPNEDPLPVIPNEYKSIQSTPTPDIHIQSQDSVNSVSAHTEILATVISRETSQVTTVGNRSRRSSLKSTKLTDVECAAVRPKTSGDTETPVLERKPLNLRTDSKGMLINPFVEERPGWMSVESDATINEVNWTAKEVTNEATENQKEELLAQYVDPNHRTLLTQSQVAMARMLARRLLTSGGTKPAKKKVYSS